MFTKEELHFILEAVSNVSVPGRHAKLVAGTMDKLELLIKDAQAEEVKA